MSVRQHVFFNPPILMVHSKEIWLAVFSSFASFTLKIGRTRRASEPGFRYSTVACVRHLKHNSAVFPWPLTLWETKWKDKDCLCRLQILEKAESIAGGGLLVSLGRNRTKILSKEKHTSIQRALGRQGMQAGNAAPQQWLLTQQSIVIQLLCCFVYPYSIARAHKFIYLHLDNRNGYNMPRGTNRGVTATIWYLVLKKKTECPLLFEHSLIRGPKLPSLLGITTLVLLWGCWPLHWVRGKARRKI